MGKKKRIIWAVVITVVLLVLVIYSFPRFMACYLYHKVVSRPLALETLGIKPQQIILPQSNNSCLFSLGFAEMALCSNSISSIRYIKDTRGIICSTDSNGITYSFLLPDIPIEVNYVTRNDIFEIKDFYDWQVRIANAMPKKYSEIFFSKPCSSMLYTSMLTLFKVIDPFNQNGIGIFETESIKGFIRFGTKGNHCSIEAEIFSKDANVTQSVFVGSESPEKSKEALFSLLSSYRFTISQANDSNVLEELIMKQFSDNSKFEIDDANK